MAPQVYARMIQTLGAEAPETDVFASRDAPLLASRRLSLAQALGFEGVGAHVLAWLPGKYQTYGGEDRHG